MGGYEYQVTCPQGYVIAPNFNTTSTSFTTWDAPTNYSCTNGSSGNGGMYFDTQSVGGAVAFGGFDLYF
jgi:hypothetical protein